MPIVSQSIGRLPTWKGAWVAGRAYKRMNRVTYLGSELQAKRDGILAEPITLINDGNDYIISPDWDIISNGTDAMIIAHTVNRVYTSTETAWAALQDDAEAFATFCQNHRGWSVDVVEDGYISPEPEPTPEGGATFADGILTIAGTLENGILTIAGTLENGVLTL